MTPRDSTLVERAREVLANAGGIELAVLFGSHARGTAHAQSDVDIALLPSDPDMLLSEELAIQGELERACGREVDVVRLDRADPVLRFRVAREGIPLREGHPGAMAGFAARAALEYLDMKPLLDDARERYLAFLARGRERVTDPELIARKLTFPREHLGRLRRRRPENVEELRTDLDRQDALAMSLLVVVQEAIDIAFHMAADEGWGVPASYREGFEMLARHGVIDDALAAALTGSAQLRNRLAHGYASVEVDRLWRELPDGIAAFDAFASSVASYVRGGGA